ncbi:MAG TPA: thymidine phosphorylase family protein [Rhizomicrobium sp.]|nr:thymidine phosphorylase family protein [Rhizomicrobium sp.]
MSDYALKARRLGLDTHSETVVFLHKNCPVSRSEGFTSHNRILLTAGGRHAIATLYQVESDLLDCDEAGLSDATWRALGVQEGDPVFARHGPVVESLSLVRGRIFGHSLDERGFHLVISDIVDGRYSAIETTSFITACAAKPLAQDEICSLTRAMVDTGRRMHWPGPVIADKHSVGGLPGNRTTPIVVAISAALGLVIPKTSSRAITSPAGTADTMETLAPVDLDEATLRRVVEREGGCIAWGGAMRLSPADDILIRIEHALDIDSEGQMIASVLSKKIAAGSTHLVIDMPVGPTAKVRSAEAAESLSAGLASVARQFGLRTRIVRGDGNQPIGRGIGPALEAQDVLSVLTGKEEAPHDLRSRALELAGAVLELAGTSTPGHGVELAAKALDDGRAWNKFQRICEAQGGMRLPPIARFRKLLCAKKDGVLSFIDNRRVARLAKLAGAPNAKAAGVELHVCLGQMVMAGTPLCTLHAEAEGELAYALGYAEINPEIFGIT